VDTDTSRFAAPPVASRGVASRGVASRGVAAPRSAKVWRVFYAKPRAEKRAAARLAEAGHEVFLPLRAALRQWSDRKTQVEEPLFPGYLFARVDERARLAVLQDEAVVRALAFGGRLAAVPDEEVAQLQALQAAPERLAAVTQRAFPVGAEVYVARGPVRGVRGRVLAHPKRCYLLVEVPSIRQAIRVHVPADWVLRPVAGTAS
jgi:transcription antitermination factor NusG